MPSRTNQEIIELIGEMHRVLRRSHGSACAEIENLTVLQLHALHTVQLNKRITMGELARELRITKASATALVVRLMRTGWLTRLPDAHDRRITHISLSAQGTTRIRAILKRKHAATERTLDGLGAARKNQLLAILRELASQNGGKH